MGHSILSHRRPGGGSREAGGQFGPVTPTFLCISASLERRVSFCVSVFVSLSFSFSISLSLFSVVVFFPPFFFFLRLRRARSSLGAVVVVAVIFLLLVSYCCCHLTVDVLWLSS